MYAKNKIAILVVFQKMFQNIGNIIIKNNWININNLKLNSNSFYSFEKMIRLKITLDLKKKKNPMNIV